MDKPLSFDSAIKWQRIPKVELEWGLRHICVYSSHLFTIQVLDWVPFICLLSKETSLLVHDLQRNSIIVFVSISALFLVCSDCQTLAFLKANELVNNTKVENKIEESIIRYHVTSIIWGSCIGDNRSCSFFFQGNWWSMTNRWRWWKQRDLCLGNS